MGEFRPRNPLSPVSGFLIAPVSGFLTAVGGWAKVVFFYKNNVNFTRNSLKRLSFPKSLRTQIHVDFRETRTLRELFS